MFPDDIFDKETCLSVGVGEVLTDPSVIKSGEKGLVVLIYLTSWTQTTIFLSAWLLMLSVELLQVL